MAAERRRRVGWWWDGGMVDQNVSGVRVLLEGGVESIFADVLGNHSSRTQSAAFRAESTTACHMAIVSFPVCLRSRRRETGRRGWSRFRDKARMI